jgi:hypothetical protein
MSLVPRNDMKQPQGATGTHAAELEIVPPGTAGTLFWMLPGPAGFLETVTSFLNRHRAVAVHLHERTVLGHRTLLERALARSAFDAQDGAATLTLRVHDASQIDCDIAQHLCASDGRRQIGPAALADWHTRRQGDEAGRPAPHIVVLRPRGEQALRASWAYLSEFTAALSGSSGNTRIVLLRIDDEPNWAKADLESLRQTGQFEAAVFDGALGPDEMSSYLGMRMAIAGFASASANAFVFPMRRLARALIAEFAGFDAHFAEGLMCMSDDELMNLPQSLGGLASRLPVSDTVWRQTSAELGTLTTIEGKTIVHTLHEWHLASNAGPFTAAALKELARKKWRAHLSALMPWFEELRHAIIDELRPLLESHLAPTQGVKVRYLPHTGREVLTEIDDLECNDINAMTRESPSLQGHTLRECTALDLCFKVARVRNEIAHLRAPLLRDLQGLIQALEEHRGARNR